MKSRRQQLSEREAAEPSLARSAGHPQGRSGVSTARQLDAHAGADPCEVLCEAPGEQTDLCLELPASRTVGIQEAAV